MSRPSKYPELDPVLLQEVKLAYEQKMPVKYIAKKFGLSLEHVENLRKNGILRRGPRDPLQKNKSPALSVRLPIPLYKQLLFHCQEQNSTTSSYLQRLIEKDLGT